MTGWPDDGLRYFQPREFVRPEKMDTRLLWYLDEARHRAGRGAQLDFAGWIITSSYRTEAETIALYPDPTKRPNSPHPRGTGADWKPRPFTAETRLAAIYGVTSIYQEAREGRLAPDLLERLGADIWKRVGFEIADRHFHLDVDHELIRPHLWLGRSK